MNLASPAGKTLRVQSIPTRRPVSGVAYNLRSQAASASAAETARRRARSAGIGRGQGVRHLADQRLAQPQVLTAPVGGLLPGERDLPGHPAAPTAGGDAVGGVRGPHRRVQVDRDAGLGGRGDRLEPFQGTELIDPLGIGDVPVERGQPPDPPDNRDGVQRHIHLAGERREQ
jgi:hypothetical protein